MPWHYIDTASQVWTPVAASSNAQQIDNAQMFWNFFTSRGYSEQATAAMLGNAQHESTLNPAQWQFGSYVGNPNDGYGLMQWDPASRYWQLYCGTYGYDRTDGDKQCLWIDTQTIGGLEGNQWNGVVAPTSWNDFKVSTSSPEDLAYAFCRNWERGGWDQRRATNARYWYDYFHGQPPTPTGDVPVWLLWYTSRQRELPFIIDRSEVKYHK